MSSNLGTALLLTTLAGLSTGIGGLIVIWVRKLDDRLLALALGFSAGIMLTVSLGDMLPHGGAAFVAAFGPYMGALLTVLTIIVGIALAMVASHIAPDGRDHRRTGRAGGLYRLGIMTTVAVCIHNFPEGIATFMSSYSDIRLGLPLTLSVALHNIPEGMAVAMPVFYASKSRGKAIGFALLSGLSEPAGAILTYLLLRPLMSDILIAVMFGIIVGLMSYIAFGELIPSSLAYNYSNITLSGVLVGMLIMSGGIFAMG